LVALAFAVMAACGLVLRAQQREYSKPTELPNPYRLVEGWPTLPKNMNGGRWGEVIRVVVDPKQNVWVFHRCFNVVPPGSATCVNRGPENPPILEFDQSGKLLKSFGAGLFAYPHGFTLDRERRRDCARHVCEERPGRNDGARGFETKSRRQGSDDPRQGRRGG
jgi:hypothetical protein